MKHPIKNFITLLLPAALGCSMAYQNAYATPLPIGSITGATSVTCPSGAATGATCKHITVTGCKTASGGALPDLGVTIGITRATSPKGTIILHSGGPATGFFNDNGFPDYYVGQGYNVIQMAWDQGVSSQGWNSDGNGVLYHACRPATVFQWLYNNFHSSGAFCGQGISGGAAVFAYALAHYQNTVSGHTTETQQYLFDYVLMASGPANARMDVGCDTSVYNNQNIVNCGVTSYPNSSKGTPFYGFAAGGNPIDIWEGTSTCGTSNPPTADVNTWARDSVISTGPNAHTGVFSYGQTNISFYFCGSTTNNQSLGLSWLLTQKITPKNTPLPINCFTQCTDESVWNDANAVAQTKSDMAKYCVLNTHT